MKNNPLVAFLRTYGPTPSSDTMYDEHVIQASERHGVEPITEVPPRLSEIVENFTSSNPHTMILTGTAGDGKTYHCRLAYQQLGGNANAYALSGKMVSLPLPNCGKHLHIIKDLSDMRELEKEQELKHIAAALLEKNTNRIYLIAANDGQLLKFWRDFSNRHPSYQQVESTFRGMLKDELETDPQEHLNLRLINLSRQPHHQLFNQLLDKIVDHSQWSQCQGCEIINICPVQLNRNLLRLRGSATLRGRMSDLIRIAAANDAHFPVRQLLILIVNILLGDASPPFTDTLLTCQKAHNRALDTERGFRATNPYQNAFGLNLRSKIREQYHAFRTLAAFGIGRETSNAIDNYLVYREAPDADQDLPETEPRYGLGLFESLRQAYLRGDIENFAEFRYGLESQRRRLFFDLPDDRSRVTNPWRLTIFQHGGDYLRFMDRIRHDPTAESGIKAHLILGLNRTFTGTLCENRDALWVASPAANGYDRLGRVLECPPISLGGGSLTLLSVGFDASGLGGRLRLTVTNQLRPDVPLAMLELRPLLFEYLLRVAEGSLPSSFSRQCYEEVRKFRLKLASQLRGFLAQARPHKLDLVCLDEQSGKLQQIPMILSLTAGDRT